MLWGSIVYFAPVWKRWRRVQVDRFHSPVNSCHLSQPSLYPSWVRKVKATRPSARVSRVGAFQATERVPLQWSRWKWCGLRRLAFCTSVAWDVYSSRPVSISIFRAVSKYSFVPRSQSQEVSCLQRQLFFCHHLLEWGASICNPHTFCFQLLSIWFYFKIF